MSKRIIALDLGLTVTASYILDEKRHISTCSLKKTSDPKLINGIFLHNFVKIMPSLEDFDLILYHEVTTHRGKNAAEIYGALKYTLLMSAYEAGKAKDVRPVPTLTIKKFLTNDGKANKEKMIHYAQKEKGFEKTKNMKEAIACALLLYGEKKCK